MTEPSQYFKGRTVQEQMDEVIGYVDVRSAEVATDAIAADVAAVHQDKLDADAYATAAAASAAAAAGTLANAVKKTGEASQSIAGDVAVAGDLTGGTVTVPAPVNNTDAASKKYVDDQDALDAKLVGATFTGQLNASGQRAYSPGNTTDVATIGTLDAYTPMVRIANDQTIAGVKTFYCARAPWAMVGSVSSRYKWFEIMTFAKGQTFQEVLLRIRSTRDTIIYECHIAIDTANVTLNKVITTINTELKVAYYDDGTDMHIYVYTPTYGYFVAEASYINGYRNWQSPKFTMTEAGSSSLDNLPDGAVEVTI